MNDDDKRPEDDVPEGDLAQPGKNPLYMPDQVEATRERMQGLGLGADEIAGQRDPTRIKSVDETADDAPSTRDDTERRH